MKLEWKTATGKYESGQNLFMGRVKVGTAHYSGMRSKGDPLAHACSCVLPGLKPINDRYVTIEEAKARVELAVEAWLEAAGLASTEGAQ